MVVNDGWVEFLTFIYPISLCLIALYSPDIEGKDIWKESWAGNLEVESLPLGGVVLGIFPRFADKVSK